MASRKNVSSLTSAKLTQFRSLLGMSRSLLNFEN